MVPAFFIPHTRWRAQISGGEVLLAFRLRCLRAGCCCVRVRRAVCGSLMCVCVRLECMCIAKEGPMVLLMVLSIILVVRTPHTLGGPRHTPAAGPVYLPPRPHTALSGLYVGGERERGEGRGGGGPSASVSASASLGNDRHSRGIQRPPVSTRYLLVPFTGEHFDFLVVTDKVKSCQVLPIGCRTERSVERPKAASDAGAF